MDIMQVFRKKIEYNQMQDKELLKKIEEMIAEKLELVIPELFEDKQNEITLLDSTNNGEDIRILLNGELVGILVDVTLPSTGFVGLMGMFEGKVSDVEHERYREDPSDDWTECDSISFTFDTDYTDIKK